MSESRLSTRCGYVSLQGRRDDNQDFGGYSEPATAASAAYGVVAAVADGVAGAKGGRVAAEMCVQSFLDGYYSLPLTLGVERTAAHCLKAANAWIHAVGRRDPQLTGMAATFSALILRDRQAHVIHVGDSRVYRLRGASLERLTEDHCYPHPDMDHVLLRAVGIEQSVRADHARHGLERHDRFLLCSDGVHAVVPDADIRSILQARASPEASAQALAELALERGSQDNITALVMDVIDLPLPSRSSLEASIGALPLLELPRVGQVVDGYALERQISSGRYSAVFVAHDPAGGAERVLKFPHPRVADNEEYYRAFLREAWIGSRVHSPWVAEIVEPAAGARSRLYTVMPYYSGKTLDQLIAEGRRISLEEGVGIGLRLCKAVHALHRLRIIHRDIKPDNILLTGGDGLRLLDLGVARLPAWDDDPAQSIPGTASYLAPEQFAGDRGSEASDIFAAGVTLYRMFAGGAYPYGEIEPFTHPRFEGRLRSLAVYRPDLPVWLDAILAKALAVNPAERPADIVELAYELENGLAKGGQVRPAKRAWYERNPLLFWKTVALLLLVLWLATLAAVGGDRGSRAGSVVPPEASRAVAARGE
jgi:serine/threonine protein phosphatase PrpC